MTMFPPESPCPKCGTDLSLSAAAVKTSPEVGEMVDLLQKHGNINNDGDYDDLALMREAASLLLSLQTALMQARASFQAIQLATIEGRVCEDVAWFSSITTLHDYCASAIETIDKSIEAPAP